jgi:hypothetical protein
MVMAFISSADSLLQESCGSCAKWQYQRNVMPSAP